MMSVITRGFLFLAALALSYQCSFAQVPSGAVTFAFTAAEAPVYDLSGPYQLQATILGAGDIPLLITFGISMTQDVRGRLSGSDSTTMQIGDNDFVAGTYTVSGKVQRSGDETRVQLQVRLEGDDVIAGTQSHFSVKLNYTLMVEDLSLVGKVRGSVNLGKLGSAGVSEEASLPLPDGVDGAWVVNMQLLPLMNITGTGTIVIDANTPIDLPPGFPHDRQLTADVRGRFSRNSATTTLNVAGTGTSTGNKLELKVVETQEGIFEVTQARGVLLGQRVDFKAD